MVIVNVLTPAKLVAVITKVLVPVIREPVILMLLLTFGLYENPIADPLSVIPTSDALATSLNTPEIVMEAAAV